MKIGWSPAGSNSMKDDGPFRASGKVRPVGTTNLPLSRRPPLNVISTLSRPSVRLLRSNTSRLAWWCTLVHHTSFASLILTFSRNPTVGIEAPRADHKDTHSTPSLTSEHPRSNAGAVQVSARAGASKSSTRCRGTLHAGHRRSWHRRSGLHPWRSPAERSWRHCSLGSRS